MGFFEEAEVGMSRFWEENRKLLTGLGAAVLGLLALRFTVVGRQLDAARISRDEPHGGNGKSGKSAELEKQREGAYEISGAVAALKQSNRRLADTVTERMERVEIPFHPWVEIPPGYKSGPGAYFVLQHEKQLGELQIVCQVGAGDGRPTVLRAEPFKDILSRPLDTAGAKENLNRLSIVRRLVELLARSGVSEIVKIVPGEPVETGPPGHGNIMREYPVSIHVRTRRDPLMTFLHGVRRPGEFFLVVRELDVKVFDPTAKGARGAAAGADGDELTVVITAAGMRRLTEEERTVSAVRRPAAAPVKRVYGVARGH